MALCDSSQILLAVYSVKYYKSALNEQVKIFVIKQFSPQHQSADERCLGKKNAKRKRHMCMLIVSHIRSSLAILHNSTTVCRQTLQDKQSLSILLLPPTKHSVERLVSVDKMYCGTSQTFAQLPNISRPFTVETLAKP